MNLYSENDKLAETTEVIVYWEANVLLWFRPRHCAEWKGTWDWVDPKLRVALFLPDCPSLLCEGHSPSLCTSPPS